MHGKLARWAMLLSEYDFQLEHRSGTKMGNVDGLNRSALPDEELQLEDHQLQEIWEVGLEEDEVTWAAELHLEGEVSTNIKEVNMMRKEVLSNGECNLCGQGDGKGKKVKCALCGGVQHAMCAGMEEVKKGYYYCPKCVP